MIPNDTMKHEQNESPSLLWIVNFFVILLCILVAFVFLCIMIGATCDFLERFFFTTQQRIHPRITEECEKCENIGEQYTSSHISEIEYSEQIDCPICMGSMEINEIERLRCGHMFHRECLSAWMNLKYNCPSCRSKGCCVRIIDLQIT